MDTSQYFMSLAAEMQALKNRVRNFIHSDHWQTDGEWKESVLRATLNRHLPAHIEAVRGFVIGEESTSGQIDVLLFDNRKPALFRDGDLVFATPDAVVGLIEVKSKVASRANLRDYASKLADTASWICDVNPSAAVNPDDLFVGLFAYEVGGFATDHGPSLAAIGEATQQNRKRVVNHISLGEDYFARYWSFDPSQEREVAPGYDFWHSYQTPGLATGYFIHNVLHHVSESSVSANRHLYFPKEGKEGWKRATHSLTAV